MSELLTQEEYCEDQRCPVCKSEDLYYGHTDFDERGCWLGVQCEDCGASWVEEYERTGYDHLEKPEADEEKEGEKTIGAYQRSFRLDGT